MRTVTMSTTSTTTARTSARVLNTALWILQLLVAALFFWHGQFMAFPPADMVAMINENIGEGLRVFISVAEILAAIGLILSGLTRILPWLTALAAAGLMIVMSSAPPRLSRRYPDREPRDRYHALTPGGFGLA